MPDDVDNIFEKEILKELLGETDKKTPEKCTFFRELAEEKIDYDKTTEEIAWHDKFIGIVDRLNCRFPFFNIYEFIEDYVNGVYTKNIIRKYQFSKNDNMAYCLSTNNLNLRGTRKKIVTPNDKTGWARRSNLSDSKISEMYNHIISESDYFKEELDYLLHYNIARAMILSKLLKTKMDMDEILKDDEILNEKSEFPFLGLRILDGLHQSVLNDEKIKNMIQDKFEDIQTELEQKNILQFQNNKYELKLNYDDIENSLKEIINDETEGLSFGKIFSKLVTKHNIILLIPHYDFISKCLENYEEQGIIKVEKGFASYGIASNLYYSISNYQPEEDIKKIKEGGKKFFGRPNEDSFQFIDDLQYLSKGDFEDDDDQVTRIAGLILVATQNLITESEERPEFDFAVDMTSFSPDDKESFKMFRGIEPNCKIIHVKVMINEDVTVDTVESLQKILPENEQAVIISFKKIPEKVQNSLPKDFSVQIIGKADIKLWADITPVVPSRKGAIIKVMDGKYVGKIAKLDSINYETGKADIELIPSSEEVITYVGHLQEINLFDYPIMDDHSVMSKNYFEFLNILGENTEGDELQKAIFKYEEEIANAIVKDKVGREIENWNIEDVTELRVKLQSNSCIIQPHQDDFESIFSCTCDYFQSEKKFCIHLLTVINEIGIRNNCFSDTWGEKDDNLLFACLKKIQSDDP